MIAYLAHRLRDNGRDRGITLVETLVTMVVFSVVMVQYLPLML